MGYMTMEEYLRYRARDWIEEAEQEARAKGLAQGVAQGMVQTITDFLTDLGDIPQALTDALTAESDPEILRQWVKLSAKAMTIDDFIEKAHITL